MITAPSTPTRDRLIAAGLRLFAERGFLATTVGQIEADAGLQPRRGALYRHFRSKEALLEAAVRMHIEAVLASLDEFMDRPRTDVRDEALELGRIALDALAAERPVIAVFENDGERVRHLRHLWRERISEPANRAMAGIVRRWLGDAARTVDTARLDAAAMLLLGSLVNVHRSTETFGAPPLGLDDDAAVAAWADFCVVVTDGLARARPRPHTAG
ncbi:MAG: TetR/AcrR family transcriptional regulator [Jiangellaceae bacterium]